MRNLTTLWNDLKHNNIIAYRLLIYILIFSSTITLLTISFQLYVDYKNDLAIIDEQMEQVQSSRLKSIALSIWEIHYGQLESQLDGILSIRDIEFIQLEMFFEEDAISIGTPPVEGYGITKTFEITIDSLGEIKNIGRLKIMASKQNVVARLKDKVLLIVISQFFKTFLVSIFTLLIFYQLVTRHLSFMAHYTGSLTPKNLMLPLKLEKKTIASQPDELDKVVSSINSMRLDLITYLNKQEESKRAHLESEAKYHDLYNRAPDMYVSVDAKTALITECNETLTKALGYTKEEIIGQPIFTMYSPESAEYAKTQVFPEFLKTGLIEGEEMQAQRKDGRCIDVLLNVSAVRSERGEILSSRSSWRDITERKRAAENERASKAFWDKILNNITDPIFVKDDQHRMILVNDAFCSIFGMHREEIIGKTLVEHVPPDEQDHFLKIDKQVLTDGKENACEETLTANESKTLTILTKKNRYVDENGVKFLVGVIRDITERKQAEEEKVQLENRLQQSHKMESIGTLAGGIAHDFNNILATMLGYAEMAKDDCQPGSTIFKDLSEVLEAGNRAKSLVRQILAFSRQDDAERMALQPASIVKETITMLRPSLPTTIEINQDIDAVTGLVFVDPTQLNQILMNLCTNAFHAMEDTGGKLDISIKEISLSNEDLVHEQDVTAGTFIQLSIGDSGTGIAPIIRDKIFDPYFTTKEVGKGTGMGLSMVHGIVKSYGGFISLYSELGEGTVFHVFLPTVENVPLAESEINDQIPIGKESILFVDDEELLTTMGKTMLERLGYHVTVRNSSLMALETFQNQPNEFDLVITDQTMPGMTGSDLSRRMLQIRPDIPIILCTGYSTIVTEGKVKSMGIKEFAFKPLAKKDMAKLIRKVLDVS